MTSPLELATGDKIEVVLENRTRVFYFQGDDETVQIRAPAAAKAGAAAPPLRTPLGDANAAFAGAAASKATAKGPAPPPPAPPPPPPGVLRAGAKPAGAAAPPLPPPPPRKAGAAVVAPPPAAPAMSAALQDAIKVGQALRRDVWVGNTPPLNRHLLV